MAAVKAKKKWGTEKKLGVTDIHGIVLKNYAALVSSTSQGGVWN